MPSRHQNTVIPAHTAQMEWLRRFFGASCCQNGHIAVGFSVHNESGHLQAVCARCGSAIVFDGEDWRRCTGSAGANGTGIKLS